MSRMTYEDFILNHKETLTVYYEDDHGKPPTEGQLDEYIEEAYGTYCYYAANYNG